MLKFQRLLFLLALVVGSGMAGLFAQAEELSGSGLHVDTFNLDNGMQVVVIPDHRAPIVTHMVWYKVGGADEPEGQSGIAHFLEHLMFKGTTHLKEGEFSRIVANNGGQHNAFTNYDYTAYYQNVAADRLELMMKIESDRMANLDLKPEDIASERDVIIEERRMRLDNSPPALLGEQMQSVLYVAHPYGTPLIGWLDEMRRLSYQNAVDFYHRFYTPSNAILVVAGDVTVDQVKALAEKYYGVIPSHALPERVRREEPTPIAARRVTLDDPRVKQSSWRRSYLAPSFHRGQMKFAMPLNVLSEILGGGSTSRLYKRLVIDKGIATSAGASYSGSTYDLSSLDIYAVPAAGADPDEARKASSVVEAAVNDEIAKLLAKGVTTEEMTRAKNNLIAAATYSRDNISDIAQVFGQALTTGQTVKDVLAWNDRVKAVTAEDVLAAARYVLRPERSVTGLLLPKAKPENEPGPQSDASAPKAGGNQ